MQDLDVEDRFMSNKTVAIIDYGLCNLFSVEHACKHVGLDPIVTSNYDEILKADAAILPGVGAFGEAITQIREKKLDNAIYDFIKTKKPFMGVCLGLQLLFDQSEEFGNFKGLGIIPGEVKKIPAEFGKVPQMGWNTIEISKKNKSCPLIKDIRSGEFMYFIHSFYVKPENENDILTFTEYGGLKYCSSICHDNVVACQFHPEKSGAEGIRIYKNFKDMISHKETK